MSYVPALPRHGLHTRCASVVAWLESMADDQLGRQPSPRFADQEGVWLETRTRLGDQGAEGGWS